MRGAVGVELRELIEAQIEPFRPSEEERLETVLPLVKKHGAAVIGISNDETGISEDPDVRFAVAKKIVERAMDYGIPKEDVIIDPLVMPIGAMR